MSELNPDPNDWPETLATVLTCTYTPRFGRALAFGLPSNKHFHITYNYWANNQLHTADLYSDKPIPQGSLFPIHYHPTEPHRSEHADSPVPGATRAPLLTIGIIGSVVL